MGFRLGLIIFGILILRTSYAEVNVQVSVHDLTLLVCESSTFQISVSGSTENVTLTFNIQHPDLIRVEPSVISNITKDVKEKVTVFGLDAGHAVLSTNVTPASNGTSIQYIRVTIQHYEAIFHVSAVVGWIYFVAWSISFYPQIYDNWKRKSVVGLNFDFLALNVIGFVLYSLFNCGLYWIPEVENEYFQRFPGGLNPVQVNDIVFALHAVFASSVTAIQCFIFERANQTISKVARVILCVFGGILLVSLILTLTNVIKWLDFLYYCSYIKLAITLIKYVPQGYMNYRRKSTVGWSIGNIFLDFTGGMLSMLQMLLISYNYNDWKSIFGDPTKFGLGLFSVVFDLFFMFQHYILYRRNPGYIEIEGDNNSDTTKETPEPIYA